MSKHLFSLFFFLSFSVLGSCSFFRKQTYETNSSSYLSATVTERLPQSNLSGDNEKIIEDDEASQQQLDQLIENAGKIKSIEEFITKLPEVFKHSYLIGYSSRSLQEATKKSPRLILKNKSSTSLLTFNGGEPEVRGNSTIEIIQFRKATNNFEFIELQEKENRLHASEKNPKKCQSCHGSPGRPIWDSYNMWPGFVGGFEDIAISDVLILQNCNELVNRDNEKIKQYKQSLISKSGKDYEVIKDFLNSSSTHPRYKLLKPYPHGKMDRINQFCKFHSLSLGPELLPNAEFSQSLQFLYARQYAQNLGKELSQRKIKNVLIDGWQCLHKYNTTNESFFLKSDCLKELSIKLNIDIKKMIVERARSIRLEQNNKFTKKFSRYQQINKGEVSNISYKFELGTTNEASGYEFAFLEILSKIFSFKYDIPNLDHNPDEVIPIVGIKEYYFAKKVLYYLIYPQGNDSKLFTNFIYDNEIENTHKSLAKDEIKLLQIANTKNLLTNAYTSTSKDILVPIIEVKRTGKMQNLATLNVIESELEKFHKTQKLFIKYCAQCHQEPENISGVAPPRFDFHKDSFYRETLKTDTKLRNKISVLMNLPLENKSRMPLDEIIPEDELKKMTDLLKNLDD